MMSSGRSREESRRPSAAVDPTERGRIGFPGGCRSDRRAELKKEGPARRAGPSNALIQLSMNNLQPTLLRGVSPERRLSGLPAGDQYRPVIDCLVKRTLPNFRLLRHLTALVTCFANRPSVPRNGWTVPEKMCPISWNELCRPRNGWPVPRNELPAPRCGPLVPRISGVFRGADPSVHGADLPFHGAGGPNRFFDKGCTGALLEGGGAVPARQNRQGPGGRPGPWPAFFVLTL